MGRRATWSARSFRALRARQATEPVALHDAGRRRYWLYADRVYWEDDELAAADVRALVHERAERRRRRLERAHALIAAGAEPGPPRRPMPRELRSPCGSATAARASRCGRGSTLQYDHVIPVALGGATHPREPPGAVRAVQPAQGRRALALH